MTTITSNFIRIENSMRKKKQTVTAAILLGCVTPIFRPSEAQPASIKI
ncbi:unnamed protein product [Brugia timori]|uniref:TonB-dependent receptor n=1 Tax=Brugia timori TaxID=42155 RepID=A0A0R3R983_9BILA|nr:unnamed protein product [Brugia timori]